MNTTTLSDQINELVAENRRLRSKTDADASTIRMLKDENVDLHVTVEEMTLHHRQRERELVGDANRAKVAYTEINGLLNQAADLILQAARAQIGDQTPDKMPSAILPVLADGRMPEVSLS